MAQAPLSDELAREAIAAVAKHGSITTAAKALGLAWSTLDSRVKVAEQRGLSVATYSLVPEDDIPVPQILDQMAQRYTLRKENHDAKEWQSVTLPTEGPYGLLLVGDPHIDDDGADIPSLLKHIDLCKRPDVYAVNIGDTVNGWAGRLVKKYADQETSRKTGYRLAEWFIKDSGLNWLLILLGNHDVWADGTEIFQRINSRHVVMRDWSAKLKLKTKGDGLKRTLRLFAAHDFKGHSQWNPLHGPLKASMMGDWAHLYACGHKHNWGSFHIPNAERDITSYVIRARGYKMIDSYAARGMFPNQSSGQSIFCIVDPYSQSEEGFLTCTPDVDLGLLFLDALKTRWQSTRDMSTNLPYSQTEKKSETGNYAA